MIEFGPEAGEQFRRPDRRSISASASRSEHRWPFWWRPNWPPPVAGDGRLGVFERSPHLFVGHPPIVRVNMAEVALVGGLELIRHEPEHAVQLVRPAEPIRGDLPLPAAEWVTRWALIGSGWRDDDLVFCGPAGEPVNPESVSKMFDRRARAAGVPDIRFHDLRHTHAAHLIAAGRNPREISQRLGHATVAFTLDKYGHLMPEAGADAAKAVAALVDGSSAIS